MDILRNCCMELLCYNPKDHSFFKKLVMENQIKCTECRNGKENERVYDVGSSYTVGTTKKVKYRCGKCKKFFFSFPT